MTANVIDKNVQPIGSGGVLGRIVRMVACVCTSGFAFPNAFIEGMNPTEVDRKFWKALSANE